MRAQTERPKSRPPSKTKSESKTKPKAKSRLVNLPRDQKNEMPSFPEASNGPWTPENSSRCSGVRVLAEMLLPRPWGRNSSSKNPERAQTGSKAMSRTKSRTKSKTKSKTTSWLTKAQKA